MRLTHIRAFGNISKGMVDQMEAEITGRAVLRLVGMVAHLAGMAAHLVGMVALVGTMAHLGETTEVAEEGLR